MWSMTNTLRELAIAATSSLAVSILFKVTVAVALVLAVGRLA